MPPIATKLQFRKAVRVALLVACVLTPQLHSQTPESAPVLQGAPNFRDIGGYRTTDGHVTRSGVLYRSSQLSTLTPADFDALVHRNIQYIFDLRTDAERQSQPTHWPGSTQPHFELISVGVPANGDVSHDLRALLRTNPSGDEVKTAMVKLTAQLVIDGAPAIGTVLKDLAAGDSPAIVHCTAGKDRTGVTVAILLDILGVPKETIYADYLRSNRATEAMLKAMRDHPPAATSANSMPPMKPEALQALYGVDASYLDAAFQAIDQHYGSFDSYVSQVLHLTSADREALRARLLQPHP